jgi:glycerol kinase
MALDQGTTSSRCILFGRDGREVCSAQREIAQIYPHQGWVEQDPNEIWFSQVNVAQECMLKSGSSWREIAGIGITNQRETTIVWDRETGEPVYNAIVWQCRRTAERCAHLTDSGLTEMIREKTGLLIDAYFSATKIEWILDNAKGARRLAEEGRLLFGTVETWLIWKLTGGRVHITDYSNASRTMLFNIHTLKWDAELLDLFGIPETMLPEVRPSCEVYGHAESDVFGGRIPISGAAGDQQASLFGQACFSPGDAKNTYGTGCFLLMNTGETPVFSENGLLTTIAWGAFGKITYALEGSVFVAGAAVQWLRDEMRLIEEAPDSEWMAAKVADTNGVYLVPAFVGLGAPYWDPYARGALVGITRGANKYHIIRAALEAIAYQSHDLLTAMQADSGREMQSLKVDGGASSNNFLMQFQADILGRPVRRPACVESTALGAAYLAGLSSGFWQSTEEIEANWSLDRAFVPEMEHARREELLAGWARAVDATIGKH